VSPETINTALEVFAYVFGVALLGGGSGLTARHFIRKRNGNGQQAAAQKNSTAQLTPADGQAFNPENTGKFLRAIQQAPEEDARALVRALTKSIEQRPATQADVKQAIGEGMAQLREDVNGHFKVHSAAIGGLRVDFAQLPCQKSPGDDCDIVRVPVPVPLAKAP